MLVVETIGRIRRDHLVRGVPIKKIARDLRVSKNTVRKVVRGDETSWTHPGKVEAPYTVCIASASNLTGLVKSSVECRRTGL